MNRLKYLLLVLTGTVLLTACTSSPWAIERKEEIRAEQDRDFGEQQNLERRLADLEAGAQPVAVDEAVELQKQINALEVKILEGDQMVKEVESQDTNGQISFWTSIGAGLLGIGGLGKASMGKSRSSGAVENLEIKLARGELELDRLADEVHKKVNEGQAAVNNRLGQLATILQAVQAGLNIQPPQPPVPSGPPPTPTV